MSYMEKTLKFYRLFDSMLSIKNFAVWANVLSTVLTQKQQRKQEVEFIVHMRLGAHAEAQL